MPSTIQQLAPPADTAVIDRENSLASTAFARFSPPVARAVLQLFFLIAAVFVAISLSPQGMGFADGPRFADAPTDIDLYNAEIKLMRKGAGYYQAAASELPSKGYPTASVFNWRTPLPMWIFAALPEPGGRAVICFAAFLLIVCASGWIARRNGVFAGMLTAALVFTAVMPCFLRGVCVMPVLWAAVFIGLSLCAYAANWRTAAVLLGLTALAMRDLAALYCWVAAAMAIRDKNWRELALWCVGFATYAVFFWLHAHQVALHRTAEAVSHDGGWLQLGGAAFVISLAQVNSLLLALPQPFAAIYLALALLGWASVRETALARVAITASAYVILFAVIGHPFNQYWGALLAPLAAIGVALSPKAIIELWQAARGETNTRKALLPNAVS
ncbi:MAG: hypothetical protein MPJ50_14175 [Pirellulales bacterium]|nr:hypothetical protein [Pirellulales bacterium]